MLKKTIFLILILALSSPVMASDFQPRGFISNHEGEKCWYTQVEVESNFFIDLFDDTTIKLLTFDDAACMHKGDLGEFGLDVNKMMINNIITRRYSRSDANFQTKANELYPTSMLQIRGKCIQSKTYPAIGVMVYYEIKNNSITQVFHSQSIQGCKE